MAEDGESNQWRARADAVDAAQREVDRASAHLIDVQKELTKLRNAGLFVDPGKNSAMILDTIGTLSTDVAQASTLLAERDRMAPQSPGASSLRARISSLQAQIANQRSQLAGGNESLAGKLAGYEQAVLERELADKSLASATNALDAARQEALRKQIYIELIVVPNKPDEDTEPRRIRAVVTVFVLMLAVFSVGWILLVGAKEHAQ